MRIKKNGERNLQDMSIQEHAAHLGIKTGWTGSLEQTLAYYEMHAAESARFLTHRQFAWCNNHALNVDVLANAITALSDLAAHVRAVKEAQA